MNVIVREFVNGEFQIVIKGIKLLYDIVNVIFSSLIKFYIRYVDNTLLLAKEEEKRVF